MTPIPFPPHSISPHSDINREALINAAIADLYAQSDARRPTNARPIVALEELTRGYSVTCRELPGLTSRVVSDFLLKRGGLVSPLTEANNIPLAGFLYATGDYGSVFVEKNDLVVRRRFSVAHELGHYLLHFRPLLRASGAVDGAADWATDAFAAGEREEDEPNAANGHIAVTLAEGAEPPPAQFEQMEREANEFAACLLMPADLVTTLAAQYGVRYRREELSWRLATEMLVSHAAMRWRLRQLDISASLNAGRN